MSSVALLIISFSAASLPTAQAAGTVYYVDNTVTDTHVASATADCTNYHPAAFSCRGGSASAYKTVADINAGSFRPDDQILFRRGQTWREQLTVPSSGAAGHPITFGAYGSGAKPVISGSDLASTWTAVPSSKSGNPHVYVSAVAWTPYIVSQDGVRLTKVAGIAAITSAGQWSSDGASVYVRATDSADPDLHTMEVGRREYSVDVDGRTYVAVVGLELSGANENGVVLQNGANYAVISSNTVKNIGHHDWGTGIHFKGATHGVASDNDVSAAWSGIIVEGWYAPLSNDNTIRRNTIHDIDSLGTAATKGNVGNPQNTLFEYNDVYRCVLVADDNPGIGTYYAGTGTVIRYNRVRDCGSAAARGSGINVDTGSASTRVHGNVVYGNNYGGINLTASGHYVYNNTLYHNNEGTADAGEISIFTQESVNGSSMTIKNNILVASKGKHLIRVNPGNTTGHALDHNDFHGGSATPFGWGGADSDFAAYKTTSGQDAHSLNLDPRLANPAGEDFALQAASHAIDVGADLGTDYQLGLNPSSGWPASVSTLNQNSHGSGWDMGAYVYPRNRSGRPVRPL